MPGHDAPSRGGRDHHSRGVRQLGAQRHRLPARRRLPRRDVRRHAVRRRDDALPARPSRHAGFRPQVQDRLLRLRAACLRPAQHARPRPARRHEAWWTASRSAASTMYVGGGLGAVPHHAKVFEEFVAEDELLPLAQAIARVFARLGEKRNRARARIKFLVKSLGIDEFRRLVREERTKLPHDPRWTSYIPKVADVARDAAQVGRRTQRRRAAGRLRHLARAERLPPAPAGLRRRHRHPAARRHHRRSDARPRRHRAHVRRRHRPHHGRAEHRPALGARGGPAAISIATSSPIGLGDARGTDDRRRHRLPGHRHLQARHRLVARPGAASCATA